MTRALWLVLGTVACAVVLNGCTEATKPDGGGITAMEAQPCEQNPEMCGSGGGGGGGTGDPAPDAPGIFIGNSFSLGTCVSPSGANINDVDRDGLDDYCEFILAWKFLPAMSFASYDCDTGGERYWAAKVFPDQGYVVRLAYLPSYYVDCGTPDESGCDVIGACTSHYGDSEFIIVDIRYNVSTRHWYLVKAFLSAHWQFPESYGSQVTQSTQIPGNFNASAFTYPTNTNAFPQVWVAQGKHANYPTRAACNAGGAFGYDTCDGNPDSWVQLDHNRWHNVGSLHANMINTGSCVTGGRLVATYPDAYGIECYWVPNDDFQGWSTARPAASPYYNGLFVKFECYSYPMTARYVAGTYVSYADAAWIQGHCNDWGVRR